MHLDPRPSNCDDLRVTSFFATSPSNARVAVGREIDRTSPAALAGFPGDATPRATRTLWRGEAKRRVGVRPAALSCRASAAVLK